ncbi:pentatricopeptide repeat-containing protein At5g66520-like [Lycium ferocissimum]|uniref:pentatricopeptide repeat-containing protein At5g66520-like n=1 Tax=Lycium ferocissimum TaxID=112874 RepID=UPI002816715C|nr:pentatricopeptide repeat-containing protein At5g66520-like [Lycium ferocissimum]
MPVEESVPAKQRGSRALQQRLFSLLRSCKFIKQLTQIHAHIITNGFTQKNFILVRLLSPFLTSYTLKYADQIFHQVQSPSTTLWNQIIRGHARSENPQKSIELFCEMEKSTAMPDGYTYSYVLNGCAKGGLLREGQQLHVKILKNWSLVNVFVQTNLVNLYSTIGGEYGVDDAQKVFDEMIEKNVVTWNSLLFGYFRNGDVDEALRIFDEMPDKNVVSWTSVIAGCTQNGRCQQAVALFRLMQRRNVEFDQVTLVAVLSACAELGALDLGKWIHSSVVERFRNEPVLVSLYNALIHMYASCGEIEEAYRVFEGMPRRNLVSWTGMITGFAKQGYVHEALTIFQQMESWGGNDVTPDEITFLGVLFACSHAGYVNEGYQQFRCMKETRGIEPRIEHYGCMVDMLSRAGLFDEAVALVETMPMKPNEAVWGALLGGCKIHKNVRLASSVAQKLAVELEPDRAAGYFVLLSNLYATDKRWRDVVITRQKMFGMGVKKPPGQSKIETDGTIHNFLSSDLSNKHACSVYEMLGLVTSQAKLQGYQPSISEEELII